MAKAHCNLCTPDKHGHHQEGCPNAPAGRTGKRKSKSGLSGRQNSEPNKIAAHASDWGGSGPIELEDGKEVVNWVCTVCGASGGQTDSLNKQPRSAWHREINLNK